MQVVVIERAEVHMLAKKVACSGEAVRQGWKELLQMTKEHTTIPSPLEYGYVLVPEWQWELGVQDLWVGIKAWPDLIAPLGTDLLHLPRRSYARIQVRGDRDAMAKAHEELTRWFLHGNHLRDTSYLSFRIEANALQPVNPFEIPAHVISYFDYDIYVPIQ